MPGTVLFWGIWGSACGFGALCIFLLALFTSLSSGWAACVSTMLWAPTLSLGITFDNISAAKSGACGGCRRLFPLWFGAQDPMPLEMLPKGWFPLPIQKLGGHREPYHPPVPCRAGGRRAAAFLTLYNFHFNGFSFFSPPLLHVSFHFS